jgi:large subunit ribosomal protein L3
MIRGVMGRKLGMGTFFAPSGRCFGVTQVRVGPCYVTQIKTRDRDGYNALQIGFEEGKKLSQPEMGHLKSVGKRLKVLCEFRCDDPEEAELGQEILVDMFKPGDKISVKGVSKGKGFAGGVKRYHFRGGPKTHGQSDRQRAPGSIGGTTYPGKVFKGKKMAGHMGSREVTIGGTEVVGVDPEKNLLFLKGGVPGAPGSMVILRKEK